MADCLGRLLASSGGGRNIDSGCVPLLYSATTLKFDSPITTICFYFSSFNII